MKIRSVGAEFHADGWTDGRTDMTKLTVTFPNFVNAPTNYKQNKLFLIRESVPYPEGKRNGAR